MALPTTFPLAAAHGSTVDIPSVGYGTWAAGDTSWAKDSTLTALKEGYRHIDAAWYYGVDEPVGQAINESGIPRKEIFVTSKIWPQFLTPDNVELCLDKILKNMELEYVDLLLAHWPCAWESTSRPALEQAWTGPNATPADKGYAVDDATGKPIIDWQHTSGPVARAAGHDGSFVATWQAMQALVATGKVRAVGVSNFSIAGLQELLPVSQDVPISCNQVEVHPWLPQTELIEWSRAHGILTSCYSPFAGQKADGERLLDDPTVKKIAEKNGVDPGQLLGSWAVQRGTVPLGKSSTPTRIRSNLAIQRIPDEDVRALNDLVLPPEEGRTVRMDKDWDVPFFSH